MSVLEWRGGFPVVIGGTAATTGAFTDDAGKVHAFVDGIILGAHQRVGRDDGRKGPITSKWVEVRNLDTGINVLVFFTAEDAAAGDHYVTLVGSATGCLAKWEGPAELQSIWVKSASGTPRVEITAFHRRG